MEKQPALKTMPHMVLRDMGPHIFVVARAAFGEMQSIYAVPVLSYEGIHVPDAALCMLKAKSGAVIHCDLVHEWGDRFTAQGEKGRIVLEFYSADDREALMAALLKMDKPWKS